MREILFKAKRVDNGKWIEGCYLKRFDCFGFVEHLIFRTKTAIEWEYAKIDENTICQYTGLTDKNGNKIWENDIVKLTRNVGYKSTKGERFKVYFNTFLCHFALSTGNDTYFVENGATDYMTLSGAKTSFIEVIGNIFDNPELLQ